MRKSLARNAIANVIQMVLGATFLFILYRYINATLGVDQLGIWSVVLATASASRLADLGLSAGVTRFVARYLALKQPQQAAQAIETGAVTLMVVLALLLPAIYLLLARLLAHLFDNVHLPQTLAILPYALLSLWLTIVASVFQSGLDGCQRMDVRALLVAAGQGLMVALAFWLVPSWGLVGLAWAQVGQGMFLVICGWLALRRMLPQVSLLPLHWRHSIFQEMLGYGVNLQVATLFMLLFDPITKALMAKFGGPTAAGYFEMASQVVLKIRALIVAANKVIVPRAAVIMETEPAGLAILYRENLRALMFAALPIYGLLFAWGNIICWLLLGEYNAEFAFFLQLSVVAWLLNTFAGPAYFINMGTGRVSWNTLTHVMMGAINATLGWVFGHFYGAVGVACAYVTALMTGSLLLIITFQWQSAVGLRELALREQIVFVAVCVAVSVVGYYGPVLIDWNGHARWLLTIFLPPMVLAIAVWYHPMRKNLWARVFAASVRE